MIFPWQTTQWQQLMKAKQHNRLPHALLFSGIEGTGKKQFAHHFANTILCEKHHTNTAPCGYSVIASEARQSSFEDATKQNASAGLPRFARNDNNARDDKVKACHACCLFAAGSHPDFVCITPEENSQVIKVDQIRAIVSQMNESALQGGYRVVIIQPANAMNTNAANALLKTLEEPAPHTLFILVSNQSSRLPATIASRCQKIVFQKPDREVALAWLQNQAVQNPTLLLSLANESPLKAKILAENGTLDQRQTLYEGLHQLSLKSANPLQLAAKFQEIELAVLFDLLLNWLQDLLRFKLTGGAAILINSDYQNKLAELNQKLSKPAILDLIEHVQKQYANFLRSINLNRQLMLEELFIHWTRYVSC